EVVLDGDGVGDAVKAQTPAADAERAGAAAGALEDEGEAVGALAVGDLEVEGGAKVVDAARVGEVGAAHLPRDRLGEHQPLEGVDVLVAIDQCGAPVQGQRV